MGIDIQDLLKTNMGGLVVGALWMIYAIGDKVLRDKTSRKSGDQEVKGTGGLIDQLNASLRDAISLHKMERERADAMANKVAELSAEVASMKATLKFTEERKEALESEVKSLRCTVEQLVIEARNKDRSITELVELNRKMLRSMGAASIPAEVTQPE